MLRDSGMSRSTGFRAAAFTLAELLLCVFVIALAVMGLFSVLIYANRARTVNHQRLQASAAAVDVMAQLEHQLRLDFDANVARARAQLQHELSYAVSQTSLNGSLQRIQVEVFYRDLEGTREGVYRLETLFRRP